MEHMKEFISKVKFKSLPEDIKAAFVAWFNPPEEDKARRTCLTCSWIKTGEFCSRYSMKLSQDDIKQSESCPSWGDIDDDIPF